MAEGGQPGVDKFDPLFASTIRHRGFRPREARPRSFVERGLRVKRDSPVVVREAGPPPIDVYLVSPAGAYDSPQRSRR